MGQKYFNMVLELFNFFDNVYYELRWFESCISIKRQWKTCCFWNLICHIAWKVPSLIPCSLFHIRCLFNFCWLIFSMSCQILLLWNWNLQWQSTLGLIIHSSIYKNTLSKNLKKLKWHMHVYNLPICNQITDL